MRRPTPRGVPSWGMAKPSPKPSARPRRGSPEFDAEAFLLNAALGHTSVEVPKRKAIFSQGGSGDSVYYIRKGQVRISVVSHTGKEATLALLGRGDFIGEDCIGTGQKRIASAIAISNCDLIRVNRTDMMRAIHSDPAFSDMFVAYLLARNTRIQEDLIDQLFNSSEKRLARTLLLMAGFGHEDGKRDESIPRVSQETLAEMIGTTRSRVNFFMNRFRRLGFIEYNGGLKVHGSLLNIILHE
jgi:CRP/FNR family transcriptional regulator, cyclic AMP receptor protein